MTLAVSEIFHSIQGEGSLSGIPSTFVRLARCNLSCSWCDAAYTWKHDVKYKEMTVDEAVAAVAHEHVVVTGGEPTYSDEFDELIEALHDAGKHITVETNGTIVREKSLDLVNLWSVSPKFGSSGQSVSIAALREFNDLPWHQVQWKFVIDGNGDWMQMLGLLRSIPVSTSATVFVQPNGLCHSTRLRSADDGHTVETDSTSPHERKVHEGRFTLDTPYLDRVRWLYELVIREAPCTEYFVRAVPQTHKLAWGNRRGY